VANRRILSLLIIVLLVASGLAIYFFFQTKDNEAPIIKELEWKPTRTVNDKVYDGTITFMVEDESSIINATLEFIPTIYSHLPREAFPNETARVLNLVPVDGKFDGPREEFSVDVKNITGGREYDINAFAKDAAGNISNATLTTSYIREFENLGKQLYDKGIKIGIVYGLIPDSRQWDPYLELGGSVRPLLGYYGTNSTKDLIVTEKHMDWMSGHGINFILDVWSGRDIRDDFFKEAVSKLEIFKTSGMKFGISYVTQWSFFGNPDFGINMTDPRNIQILKEDLSYLKEEYFDHSAYLKIDGKPFFTIYGNGGMYGNVSGGLEEVYKFMKDNFGLQLYMVSDLGGPEVDENWGNSGGEATATPMRDLAPFFDAMITGLWIGSSEPWGSFENYLKSGFDYWYPWSIGHKLDYIPFISPGFSMKYTPWHPPEMRDTDPMNVPRTVELWKKRLVISIPYSDTFGIMVGDFNNIMENQHIEPTTQEGFEYLKAMKEVLEGFLK
jgi:hypothetical protein